MDRDEDFIDLDGIENINLDMGQAIGRLEDYPKVVRDWIDSASSVSTMNEVPCAMAFMSLLSTICSDMVAVRFKRNVEDCRIHFCWIQTTGSGKSTLFNFLGPVTTELYTRINALENASKYDVIDVKDFTTAALIGNAIEDGKFTQEDEEENPLHVAGTTKYRENVGILNGSGMLAFDEFENVGVFKSHNHKEGLVGHLNTMMNTLWGQNYIIKKKLTNGPYIMCNSRRSIYATTYPPKNLQEVIADTGLLQRMVLYVRETTDMEKDRMMMNLIEAIGVEDDISLPIEKYSNALFKIYTTLKERNLELKQDNPELDDTEIALKMVTFKDEVRDLMKFEYYNMVEFLRGSREEVKETTDKFTARLFVNLTKMSVLMSICEAPGITDKSKRYVVSARNVRQGAKLIRQCYIALVSWLDVALRERRQSIVENAGINKWKEAFEETEKDNEGFVLKTDLIIKFMEITRQSRPTAFRKFKKVSELFDEKKVGKSPYVKWRVIEE